MSQFLFSTSTLFRVLAFLFSYIHQIVGSQFQRALNFTRTFASNWLEFPFNKHEMLYLSSKPQRNLGILASCNPNVPVVPLFDTEFQQNPLSEHVSIWKIEEQKKLPEVLNRPSILEKSQNRLWFKIKEMARNRQPEEPVNFSPTINPKFSKETKRRVQLPGTTIKLDEYDRINREYFYKKYHSGFEVDGYSFVHPSSKSAYSKGLLIPGARLWKSCNIKPVRRKAPGFKPTELSTIFENLAY